MKILFLIVIACVFLSFVENDLNENKINYFEGQITYEIAYSSNTIDVNIDLLTVLIGSKMILTFKKGNYLKQYYSSNGTLIQERYLSLSDKKSYLRTSNSDTVYWFDITKNDSKTTFEVLSDSVFLNHAVTSLKTKTELSGLTFKGKHLTKESMHFYAKDLAVNPKWYKFYNESNFNDIIKIGKGIDVFIINKDFLWDQKIKIKSINRRKVDKSELNLVIDKNNILKEI